MNIFVLIANQSLNYFVPYLSQTKLSLARIAIARLSECSPLSLPPLKAWKGYLPRLAEAPLAAHALPSIVLLAKGSAIGD